MRPPWPEEGGLKEKVPPEEAPPGGLGAISLENRVEEKNSTKRPDGGSPCVATDRPEALGIHIPEETGKEREISPSVALHGMEADVPARNLKYACMELLNLARRELPCTWMHYSQKHRLKLHPSGKELAKFASNRVLWQEHIGESWGAT
jgi:hypothetical protein